VSAVAPVSLGHAPQPPSDATRLLYERHSGRIFGYCLSLLGSREDAEDAVQTTFINAQRGLHRGVVPQFELAWLFTIARNVCHNARQSASRRGRLESVRDLDALQDVIATPERGGSLSIAELTQALNAIPDRQRRALVLREWQGLSYEEIAAELNVSVAAVETLLFRARRSLAQQLERGDTRRSDVASVVAFFQWLFKGGAAVKVGAVGAAAATVATATVLAAAPAMRAPAEAPSVVPIAPKVHTVRSEPIRIEPPSAVTQRAHVTRPTSPPAAASASATPASTNVAAAVASSTASSASVDPQSTTSTQASAALSVPTVSTPTVSTPTVTTPTVTTPTVATPVVTVPAVSVPPVKVELPPLPAELPPLPSLP
jgi:RNA polymerase sigma factor (sigma-70 family)